MNLCAPAEVFDEARVTEVVVKCQKTGEDNDRQYACISSAPVRVLLKIEERV